MYLLVGGLGTTQEYFKAFIKYLVECEFYELTVSNSNIHYNNLLLKIKSLLRYDLRIIAFSSSCALIVDILNDHHLWSAISKVYLVDQPNLCSQLSYTPQIDWTRVHPNNKPLRAISPEKVSFAQSVASKCIVFRFLYSNIFTKAISYTYFTYIKWINNDHCPDMVNKEIILNTQFNDLYDFIYNILLSRDPLNKMHIPTHFAHKCKSIYISSSDYGAVWRNIEDLVTNTYAKHISSPYKHHVLHFDFSLIAVF